MAQAQKESPETVLLRHPLPKYNFQAKKLPKESPASPQGASLTPGQSQTQDVMAANSGIMTGLPKATNLTSAGTGPIGQRSAAVRPFSSSHNPAGMAGGDKSAAKPVAAVVAPNVRGVSRDGKTGGAGVSGALGAVVSGAGKEVCQCDGERPRGNGRETVMSYLPQATIAGVGFDDIPVPDAALLAHTVEGPSTEEKLAKAEGEIAMLKGQLEVQLQVNAEIKRLLVASVGDDFERKVENLARDRAELAMELGDFTKKMTEDYENLDQISIQADMWRSKYLASRVMVEELASARAFYSSHFHDSQQAVQELLNERYELRTGLLQSYKCLQQVKEAFDPLNAQKSHSLPSTNVLDLAKHVKQLSEAVRFRLLPAHAGSHIMMPLEESWESTMTKAELLAYDQLSKQATPPSFKHSMPSATPPVLTPSKSYERFHPLVRHDNLTVNCCTKCKGEIKVA